jgi:hypothetical protein
MKLFKLVEAKGDKEEYQKKFKAMLAKHGVKSIEDLSDKEKIQFFNHMDDLHTSDEEEMNEGCGKEGCNCPAGCDCGPDSDCGCDGQIAEAGYRVVALSKNGEKMKSGVLDKKKATKMHWDMAKSKKYKSVKVTKEGRNPNITRKEMDEVRVFTERNTPNDKKKWAASVSAAKKKFKVYPSAYANAWAAKNYKSKGGTWSKKG